MMAPMRRSSILRNLRSSSSSSSAAVASQQQKSPEMRDSRAYSDENEALWKRAQQQQQQQQQQAAMAASQKTSQSQKTSMGQSQQTQQMQEPNYQHFDPYAIYDDEDVWYSEERLFEHHLEEIFDRWNQLDNEIWCKLILLERNKRIGKAYARVEMVTIDGSPDLSYDGFKLAWNGFANADRDSRVDDCRRRIGKGIGITMDVYGNIFVKRCGKANVYAKQWTHSSQHLYQSASSSGSTANELATGRRRGLPGSHRLAPASQSGASSTGCSSNASASIPSSTNSSMDAAFTDSSVISDELLRNNGKLEMDKFQCVFDEAKFQKNVVQELGRAYPNRRKLEQQCFSIVGLVRDADEVLNLPCWIMVINIKALKLLDVKLPRPLPTYLSDQPDDYTATGAGVDEDDIEEYYESSRLREPNFVSIFGSTAAEQNNNIAGKPVNPNRGNKVRRPTSTEEDPYSLPACDYPAARQPATRQSRSKQPAKMTPVRTKTSINQETNRHQYNGYNQSIYSPGHMLIQPPTNGDATGSQGLLPPKLPPRDFPKRSNKSRSTSNIGPMLDDDPIYAPGGRVDSALMMDHNGTTSNGSARKVKTSKSSRLFESLALKSSSSNKVESTKQNASASVSNTATSSTSTSTSSSGTATATKPSGSRNFRSLFSRSKQSKQQQVASESASASDDSNYVRLRESEPATTTQQQQQHLLDIPTPDYETSDDLDNQLYPLDDEPNFAPNHRLLPAHSSTSKRRMSSSGQSKSAIAAKAAVGQLNGTQNRLQMRSNAKDDLYYPPSGFIPPPQRGARIRSASMQRGPADRSQFGRRSQLAGDIYAPAASIGHNFIIHSNDLLADNEMPYGLSLSDRLRPASRQQQQQQQQIYAGHERQSRQSLARRGQMSKIGPTASTMMISGHPRGINPNQNHLVSSSSNYDIGRSSSGIYGNNSSSSSSDYADWQPQMRKVSSSGYLNSIFKQSDLHNYAIGYNIRSSSRAGPADSQHHNHPKTMMMAAGTNQHQRLLKSSNAKDQAIKQRTTSIKSRATSLVNNNISNSNSNSNNPSQEANYRAYDSSNDSDPSYTNSSDGLDIYDHIGANGGAPAFTPSVLAGGAPEVHVGEWEHMYER